MKDKKKFLIFIFLFFMVNIPLSSYENSQQSHAFSPRVLQKGATGDDVIELQARLQYLGFYNGDIDGVFGWRTYWAVRNFQYEFGLTVDGLVGAETKERLVRASRFDREFIHEQIRQGRDFTYYGGAPKEQQVKRQPDRGDRRQIPAIRRQVPERLR